MASPKRPNPLRESDKMRPADLDGCLSEGDSTGLQLDTDLYRVVARTRSEGSRPSRQVLGKHASPAKAARVPVWRKATLEEKREATRQALVEAQERVRAGATLLEAVSTGTVAGWWARIALASAARTLSLPAWDAQRHRTQADRLRVLELALQTHGGGSPLRRGGWRVSSTS